MFLILSSHEAQLVLELFHPPCILGFSSSVYSRYRDCWNINVKATEVEWGGGPLL